MKLALGDVDPEFTASRRLFTLKQANHTFTDFYSEFKLTARRTPFHGSGLKQLLRHALSRELTDRLAVVDVRQMSYEDFIQECLRQDNLLRAVTPRQATKSWRSVPAPVSAPALVSVPIASHPDPAAALRPASAPYDPMDLDHSHRQTPTDREAERERCRALRLCFYCASPDHRAHSCPEKSKSLLLSLNVRTMSPTFITSASVQIPAINHSATSVTSEQLKDLFLD